jgi:hypothetical protein
MNNHHPAPVKWTHLFMVALEVAKLNLEDMDEETEGELQNKNQRNPHISRHDLGRQPRLS